MPQPIETLEPMLTGQPVIPVIVIDDADKAVPMAKALVAGGLPAIEITLRTSAALEAIRNVAEHVPDAIVGAGTALNAAQFDAAVDAGSRFVVSPGFTAALGEHAGKSLVPLLPGTTSPSEIMLALELGYSILKFFPAEQSGGAGYLKSLSSPFGGVRFCPTGGVSVKNAADYLALPNVICVGGSWITPKDALDAGDWDRVTQPAKEASQIPA